MDAHPFVKAWQTRDAQAWGEALATDVVLHSPVIKTPISGRDAVVELYAVLFSTLGEVTITEQLASESTHAFHWLAEVGKRTVEGVDFVTLDDDGKVREIRVMIRPLVDIGAFAATVGPEFGRRRSALRATAMRIISLPLVAVLGVVDAIATRLGQIR